MARLIGTGEAPDGQYPEGQVFDVPAYTDGYDQLIEKGWAKAYDRNADPGATITQVASAMVRGDTLSLPGEQEIVEQIGDRALAIVEGEDDASGLESEASGGLSSDDPPELSRGAADREKGLGSSADKAEDKPKQATKK